MVYKFYHRSNFCDSVSLMVAPLELHAFGPAWGVPFATAAPFPLKLEAWLRLANVPYRFVVANDPRKGPKKKSPWIVDDRGPMGDSELIIAYLSHRHGVDPDAGLTAAQRALALAWHRTFEEHYHQALEHELFLGRGGEARLRELMASLPRPVRPLVSRLFLRQLRAQLCARGLGRHDPETIVAMGKADLDAASTFLGDRPFFVDDRPRTLDACAFGFLAPSIYLAGDNPLFRHVASLPNLVAFVERMRERLFPETKVAR
jgi:glutathione S-transferase